MTMRPVMLIAATLSAGMGRTAEAPAPSRAAQTASLLLAADVAAGSRAMAAQRLPAILAALDRDGVSALPGSDDAVGSWRRLSPNTGASVVRGRVLGPAYHRGLLQPAGEMQMDQLFLAGQMATVAVAASPRQSVALRIAGPDARGACADLSTDCRWTPIFTERYKITVRNRSAMPTRFYLVID